MSTPTFSDLGLSPLLVQTISDLGYEQPSPIQAQSVPLLLAGKNLLGVAQTGTGKTAAFALPLLDRLDPEQRTPQILILTPTRELAIQVSEACQTYARGMKGFHVLPIYGGADMMGQLRALKRGAQVVVGTPGRIMDHLRRHSLDLGQIRAIVLDEADEMLRMGFIDDVETILSETPKTAQRALFSATMPAAIQRIASNYLGDAEQVRIQSKTRTVEKIRQRCLVVSNHEKMDALTRILEVEDFDGMIVFVRTKSSTVEIAEKLEARGFSASALNGDLSQTLRERTVARLKNGQLDIIVATDVAARGLDVERISHVFNYDIPYDNESYVHRIGRTGRAGRDGQAILFVNHREKRLLHSIEKSTGQAIEMMTMPGGHEVSQKRIDNFRAKIMDALETENIEPFKPLIEKWAEEEQRSATDIGAAMAFLLQQERPLFPKLVELESDKPRGYKKNRDDQAAPSKPRNREELPLKSRSRDDKPPRNRDDQPPRSRDEQAPRPRREDKLASPRSREATDESGAPIPMEKYRLEVGHNDGVQPKDVVGAIANEADIESRYIGRIEIFDDYTTVDLPEGMPRDLLADLRKMRIRNKPSQMQRVEGGESAPARRSPPKKTGKSDFKARDDKKPKAGGFRKDKPRDK